MQSIANPRHISLMAQTTHYVPRISRPIVAALFHQAKIDRTNMVRLVNRLLEDSLRGTPGWQRAERDWPELAVLGSRDQPTC
ncbi:MAG: hypothetical protein CMO55_07775 [Verrucomicrobiales bacterium]|nr:hypothetical protein [Verrucomicrobiales bacterium]